MQDLLAAGQAPPTADASSDPERVEEVDRTTRPGQRAVMWLAGGYLVLLVTYSLLVPLFRGPDEIWHVDLTQGFSDELSYPGWDERWVDPGVVEASQVQGTTPLGADRALPRGERESFEELDDGIPQARNHMPQHPPLYYALNGTADRIVDVLLPGDPFGRYDTQFWFYRLVNVLLLAPLPLIIHRVGLLVGLRTPIVLAAAAFPLAIPQFFHIGSVVNNDNLLVLLAALLVPVAVRLGRGEITTRRCLAAGGLTGLALLTKGTAMVLPVWVGLALLFAVWRGRAVWRKAATAGAVYLGTAFAAGGWWWAKNMVLEGKLAPSLEYDRFSEPTGAPTGIARFVHAWAYYTNRRFWGDFGYYDVRIPAAALIVATVVTVVGLVWAFRRTTRTASRNVEANGSGGIDLFDKLVLIAPLLLVAASVAAQAFRFYSSSGQLPLLQGRYWYPGLVGLVLLVTMGLGELLGRWVRYLPVLVLAGAGVMQLVALDAILGRYWGEVGGGLRSQLAAVRDWAPIPPLVQLTFAAVAIAVLVSMAVSVTRQSLREPADPA